MAVVKQQGFYFDSTKKKANLFIGFIVVAANQKRKHAANFHTIQLINTKTGKRICCLLLRVVQNLIK